ncbi:GIY-YIG nuclease family protein [Patescibacteria group bacterium]|nr:GIY-YIG nuclease family protein [Patescibacteria group bacterium]
MYIIYWLINENFNKTYIGFTNNLKNRLKEHKNKRVKFTRNFGNF